MTFGAIVLLLFGIVLAAVVAWRLMSGKSYITKPSMVVFRNEDPFSFWLSLAFPTGFGIVFMAGGCVMLWRAIHSWDATLSTIRLGAAPASLRSPR